MDAKEGTLDPNATVNEAEMLVTRSVFDSLVAYKHDSNELTGDLATSWDISSDGLTYTFHLRQGVKWQKGYGDFTAQNVKDSFDRILNPDNHMAFRGLLSMLKEVQVVDPSTVKMILNTPDVPFLQLLTDYRVGPIVNVKAITDAGTDAAWKPVGTGPYMVDSDTPQQDVTLVANPDYWGAQPVIKKIYMKTITDENAAVAAMENHQFDMWDARPSDPAVVNKMLGEGFVQTVVDRSVPMVLLMNLTVPPFDKLEFRQAIAYAIDRQQIIDLSGLQGIATPWYNPVPEGYIDVNPDVPRYDHDVNKAKALLAQAGFPNGTTVTLNVYQGPPELPSQVLEQQLKDVGITAQPDLLDQPTFISRVVTNQNINFAIHCCLRPPDPDFILSDMFSAKYRGAIYISHIDLESQLAAAREEMDPAKRQKLYYDLETQIMTDVDMIPIAMTPGVMMNASSLQGMPKVEPIWGYDFRYFYFK